MCRCVCLCVSKVYNQHHTIIFGKFIADWRQCHQFIRMTKKIIKVSNCIIQGSWWRQVLQFDSCLNPLDSIGAMSCLVCEKNTVWFLFSFFFVWKRKRTFYSVISTNVVKVSNVANRQSLYYQFGCCCWLEFSFFSVQNCNKIIIFFSFPLKAMMVKIEEISLNKKKKKKCSLITSQMHSNIIKAIIEA